MQLDHTSGPTRLAINKTTKQVNQKKSNTKHLHPKLTVYFEEKIRKNYKLTKSKQRH